MIIFRPSVVGLWPSVVGLWPGRVFFSQDKRGQFLRFLKKLVVLVIKMYFKKEMFSTISHVHPGKKIRGQDRSEVIIFGGGGVELSQFADSL